MAHRFLSITALLLGIAVFTERAEAQTTNDLRAYIRESIRDVADSLFRQNGEAWSGTVWSGVPEWRRSAENAKSNGFALEEISVESSGSSVDPSGQSIAFVTVTLRGELLMSDGRVIPVDLERPASVMQSGEAFEQQYADLLKKDSSVWSNIIQPTIVALGAAAVIALFFIVRS